MKQQVELTGIVLSVSVVGEFDKRLVILTKERGKITAFARGARRPGNSLMAIAVPFNYAVFHCYQGYDAYHLSSAEPIAYFEELKQDLDGVCYATYFCEMTAYFTMEGTSDKQLLNLLYVSFRALMKKQMPFPLIRRTFEVKIFELEGMGMQVFQCVKCGKEKPEGNFFDSTSGGILCGDCKKYAVHPLKLTESTLYTLQYIRSTELSRLYAFTVSEQVQRELEQVCDSYRSVYIDREFKSLEMLEL